MYTPTIISCKLTEYEQHFEGAETTVDVISTFLFR